MTYKDIKYLLSNNEGPSISIYIPTSREMSEKLQDPIRVKNTVEEAIKDFNSKYSNQNNFEIIEKLNHLVRDIDYEHTLDGIVIFVNSKVSQIFYVPFKVTKQIIISEHFNILEIVKGLNYNFRYWLLALSENPTRLFKGHQYNLTEVIDKSFPYRWLYEVTNDSVKMAVLSGNDEPYKTELRHKFMHEVDKLLTQKLHEENLPMILVGTERNMSEFKNESKNLSNIVGEAHYDFCDTPTHEIAIRLKDTITNAIDKIHNNISEKLEVARNGDKYTQGITKVLEDAKEGRIHELFIANDIDLNNPKVYDAISTTIQTDGLISFVDPKFLEENMAAILRW